MQKISKATLSYEKACIPGIFDFNAILDPHTSPPGSLRMEKQYGIVMQKRKIIIELTDGNTLNLLLDQQFITWGDYQSRLKQAYLNSASEDCRRDQDRTIESREFIAQWALDLKMKHGTVMQISEDTGNGLPRNHGISLNDGSELLEDPIYKISIKQ